MNDRGKSWSGVCTYDSPHRGDLHIGIWIDPSYFLCELLCPLSAVGM